VLKNSLDAQDERRRFDIIDFAVHAEALEAFLTFFSDSTINARL